MESYLWLCIALQLIVIKESQAALVTSQSKTKTTVGPSYKTTDKTLSRTTVAKFCPNLTLAEFEELLGSYAPCSMVKIKNYCSVNTAYVLDTRVGKGSCCVCKPGFMGSKCLTGKPVSTTPPPPLPCQRRPSPCNLDTTLECINIGSTDFKCTCKNGFNGKNCSNNINDCVSPNEVMCLNGLCVDGEGYYSCICNDGWTKHILADGTDNEYCDQDVDECETGLATCLADGFSTCINTMGSYICD